MHIHICTYIRPTELRADFLRSTSHHVWANEAKNSLCVCVRLCVCVCEEEKSCREIGKEGFIKSALHQVMGICVNA